MAAVYRLKFRRKSVKRPTPGFPSLVRGRFTEAQAWNHHAGP